MEGVDFWSWCLFMAYLMLLFAVKTHTSWLHFHCLIALRSWEAHWGLDELSENHIQVNSTDWAQVGQESKHVGQVSFASLLLSTRHVQVRWGMWRTLGAQVMTVLMCVQSPYHAESSRQRGRNMCECDPTQTGVCTARSFSQLSPSLAAS